VGHYVRLTEYEPLSIRLFASRDTKVAPDVILDGASIGIPKVIINDAELCWEWTYRSESWCGRSHLTVTSDQGSIDIVVQTVPSGTKYSEDEYDRMIGRLLAYHADLLWGLAPGQSDVRESANASPTIALPSLLNHYLELLLQQLQRILEDPVLATFREEVLRPFDLSRPIKPYTLRWLAARPAQAQQLERGDLDVLIPQQRHVETYDHPANRYIRAIVHQLLTRFERTASTLDSYAKRPLVDSPESARCVHLSRRLRSASEQMKSSLEHPVLEGVRAGTMTEGVAQVFAGHPHYGRFARIARRLLTNGIELGSNALLEASLRRSWDIFELYCLHRLVEALEAGLGPAWTFECRPYYTSLLCAPESGCFWKAVHPSGTSWELLFQQPFKRNAMGPSAITTGRQPDFVLCQYTDVTLRSWTVLDAKYRSSELSLNDALESMHVYRDSLRWNTGDTSMRPQAGYLLVPTISERLERYASDEFLAKWGIGLIDIEDETLGQRLIDVASA
jgi:hypothetical protein